MKLLKDLTIEERLANRIKWVTELESYRISLSPITSLEQVIHVLEDGAFTVSDVMLDKESSGEYSPQLQGTFDDIMDILDYLKIIKH
jgi:hypothetical protein